MKVEHLKKQAKCLVYLYISLIGSLPIASSYLLENPTTTKSLLAGVVDLIRLILNIIDLHSSSCILVSVALLRVCPLK